MVFNCSATHCFNSSRKASAFTFVIGSPVSPSAFSLINNGKNPRSGYTTVPPSVVTHNSRKYSPAGIFTSFLLLITATLSVITGVILVMYVFLLRISTRAFAFLSILTSVLTLSVISIGTMVMLVSLSPTLNRLGLSSA